MPSCLHASHVITGIKDENASVDNPFSVVVPEKDAQPASPGHTVQIASVPHAGNTDTSTPSQHGSSSSVLIPIVLVLLAFALVMTALKNRKRIRGAGDSFSDKVV